MENVSEFQKKYMKYEEWLKQNPIKEFPTYIYLIIVAVLTTISLLLAWPMIITIPMINGSETCITFYAEEPQTCLGGQSRSREASDGVGRYIYINTIFYHNEFMRENGVEGPTAFLSTTTQNSRSIQPALLIVVIELIIFLAIFALIPKTLVSWWGNRRNAKLWESYKASN